MTLYIIIYAANILALIIAMLVLINYTCRLKIKYSPIKALIRLLFFFDAWYIKWIGRWLYHNPFAIVSTLVIFCLFCLIAQMGSFLAQSNVFERNAWMLTASPVAWAGIGVILYMLPRVFPKLHT